MTGVCASCGKAQRVPSHRGSRLSDYHCRDCGGELHGKTKGKAPGAGRKRVSCVVCGRARMSPSNAVKLPEARFELDGYSREWAKVMRESVGPFEAGSPVCWHHDIRPFVEAAA